MEILEIIVERAGAWRVEQSWFCNPGWVCKKLHQATRSHIDSDRDKPRASILASQIASVRDVEEVLAKVRICGFNTIVAIMHL